MDLKEWRKQQEQGEEFVTPSGLTVVLRRVSLLDLAEQGDIPAPLVAMTNKVLDTKTHQLGVADIPEYAETINHVVKAAVIHPPVADEGDDTHVGVKELPLKDRLAIFNWVNRIEVLRPFRRERREPQDT